MPVRQTIWTTAGRGRLFDSILDTVGDTPDDPDQQSRRRPRDDLRQGGVFQSGGLGQGPAGAQHHRRGRAQRRAEARPDRRRGDQRQHRHRARHGLRAEGLSAGRHHGRQLLHRAAQADADAGRQGRSDAARAKGLRHVQEGGRTRRGQRLVPRPPVRDRGERRHSRGDDRARDPRRFRRLAARLVRDRLRHRRNRRRRRARAAPRAARDVRIVLCEPANAPARRRRAPAGTHPGRRARREPSRLGAAPDPGLDAGLHPRRPAGGDRPQAVRRGRAGRRRRGHQMGEGARAEGGDLHRHLRRIDLRRGAPRSRKRRRPVRSSSACFPTRANAT